jgi:hypothetical protein
VWSYDDIGRSISTVSITEDGLLFVAEYAGKFIASMPRPASRIGARCRRTIWGSTLVADGKGLHRH